VLLDECMHASVFDGVSASKACGAMYTFAHNSIEALEVACSRICTERPAIAKGRASLFVAVESLHSMEGTFGPLVEIADIMERFLPRGNAYLTVDEAHSTGLYGPQGRGMVATARVGGPRFRSITNTGKGVRECRRYVGWAYV
jgi:8-amino-7-oxononanoate synthase